MCIYPPNCSRPFRQALLDWAAAHDRPMSNGNSNVSPRDNGAGSGSLDTGAWRVFWEVALQAREVESELMSQLESKQQLYQEMVRVYGRCRDGLAADASLRAVQLQFTEIQETCRALEDQRQTLFDRAIQLQEAAMEKPVHS